MLDSCTRPTHITQPLAVRTGGACDCSRPSRLPGHFSGRARADRGRSDCGRTPPFRGRASSRVLVWVCREVLAPGARSSCAECGRCVEHGASLVGGDRSPGPGLGTVPATKNDLTRWRITLRCLGYVVATRILGRPNLYFALVRVARIAARILAFSAIGTCRAMRRNNP